MSNPISYYTCEEAEDLEQEVNGAGWYFWNEVWADCYGPYDTEEEAEELVVEEPPRKTRNTRRNSRRNAGAKLPRKPLREKKTPSETDLQDK